MWYGYSQWADDHQHRLQQEFIATCRHEGGHLGIGAELSPGSIISAVVRNPTNIELNEGDTNINPLPDLRSADISFAGCMAEARFFCDDLFGGGLFSANQWEDVLEQIGGLWRFVSDNNLRKVANVSFRFDTPEGPQRGWGKITSADLIMIAPNEREREDRLIRSMKRNANSLQTARVWGYVTSAANLLRDNPGHKFLGKTIRTHLGIG